MSEILRNNHWECEIGDSVEPKAFWPPSSDAKASLIITAFFTPIQYRPGNKDTAWKYVFTRKFLGDNWTRVL